MATNDLDDTAGDDDTGDDDTGDDTGDGNELAVDGETHRRLLTAVNEARRVDDLAGLIEAGADREQLATVLGARDAEHPLGFAHLRDLRRYVRIDPKVLDRIVWWFGPSRYGTWATPYSTELEGTAYHVAHAAVLKTGEVLFLPEANTRTTLLWDPSDEVNPVFHPMVDAPDERLFCAGHAFLSDGQLLVVGGGGGGPSGVNRAWRFEPVGRVWEKTAGDMTHARWYPTVVTLSDERRVLAVGGAPSNGTAEIYDELTDSFTVLTGPDAERPFPQLYPGLHLLPDGEVLYTRTGFGSAGAGPGGNGDPNPMNAYYDVDPPSSGRWVELASTMEHPDRVRGMSVLLHDPCHPTLRVLVIGGGTTPGNETAEMMTLSTLNPTWGHAMTVPGGTGRNNVNAVLLPDGTVLVVGGTADPAVPCALFDPRKHQWRTMARANYRKQYHSVAVLLPSGKVAATGGSNYGGGSNVIEIFSPPYLFNLDGSPAARPAITGAPATVHHSGGTFAVTTPDAAQIDRVTLVRPMAVTHQTDTEQRVIEMRFTRRGNDLTVTVPDAEHPHGVAPRGHYMMFLITDRGVPSEARWMFLH
jgi:hypothetical protein